MDITRRGFIRLSVLSALGVATAALLPVSATAVPEVKRRLVLIRHRCLRISELNKMIPDCEFDFLISDCVLIQDTHLTLKPKSEGHIMRCMFCNEEAANKYGRLLYAIPPD